MAKEPKSHFVNIKDMSGFSEINDDSHSDTITDQEDQEMSQLIEDNSSLTFFKKPSPNAPQGHLIPNNLPFKMLSQ